MKHTATTRATRARRTLLAAPAIAAVALLAAGADFGLAPPAERNLANRIREEMNLPADPYVRLGG
ncbi:hypothetical protein ACEE18_12320, partial [Corynebacterium freneyi]